MNTATHASAAFSTKRTAGTATVATGFRNDPDRPSPTPMGAQVTQLWVACPNPACREGWIEYENGEHDRFPIGCSWGRVPVSPLDVSTPTTTMTGDEVS